MEKKDIDWGSLTFAYTKTDYSYACNYKDGAWGEDILTPDHTIVMSECAGIFHYCQEVFEGLKAYTTKDGRIVCFRPDMNAQRMYDSAQRICMPPFPVDRFINAVKMVVKANLAWVPPFGSGATLYIRPFMIATGDVIGVKPATEYQFRILVTPVGPYYKGGVQPVALKVSAFDRAAPHGTGNIKAGLNYAMSLYPSVEAHAEGFADNMFLDSQTRTYVEESGGANFLFVTADGGLVVPQSFTARSSSVRCASTRSTSSSSAACAAPPPSSAPWARSSTSRATSTFSAPAWSTSVPSWPSSALPSPAFRPARSRVPRAGSTRSPSFWAIAKSRPRPPSEGGGSFWRRFRPQSSSYAEINVRVAKNGSCRRF